MELELPTELQELVCDLVRDRIRPALKKRLWQVVHKELRFAVKVLGWGMVLTWNRNQETGEILFHYEDAFVPGSRTSVPITALMDLDNQTFYYQAVSDTVKVWTQFAEQYPTTPVGRGQPRCICCNVHAIQGSVLCSICTPTYHAIVYAE